MQGTSSTKQERECKLYDKFDKFAYKKGETLRDFYLRFSLLLNDMKIYNMKLEQFLVNTKFLNTLPPEWSKFVTDVKLGNRGSLIFSNNGEGNMSLNWLDGVCCGWQTSSGVVALGVEMGLLVLVVSNHDLCSFDIPLNSGGGEVTTALQEKKECD
ncbi:hypothetical protein Tco_0522112 [Tanacetum coccineum]